MAAQNGFTNPLKRTHKGDPSMNRNKDNITLRRGRILVLVVVTMVVAMAGSATAGGLITGRKIKNNTITGIDIRDNSVTGVDIADGSLAPTDFDGNLIGSRGPQGPEGPRGPQGPQGPAGASGLEYIIAGTSITGGKTVNWGAECSPGKKVVGGGVSSGAPSQALVVESAPMDQGVGWGVGMKNSGSGSISAFAWAVCAVSS